MFVDLFGRKYFSILEENMSYFIKKILVIDGSDAYEYES